MVGTSWGPMGLRGDVPTSTSRLESRPVLAKHAFEYPLVNPAARGRSTGCAVTAEATVPLDAARSEDRALGGSRAAGIRPAFHQERGRVRCPTKVWIR